MSAILQKIAMDKRLEVEELKITKPLEQITGNMPDQLSHLFKKVLSCNDDIHIIAELKKGSPSKGILVEDFNVDRISTQYAEGGAVALSVLTERKYFFGRSEYMAKAKQSAELPVLCKDFIIDEYQIYYARYMCADAILLIASLLTTSQLKEFQDIASELGVDCLVEVHNEDELSTAIEAKSCIIGVNNRNLNDFSVSLSVSENLSALIPDNVIKVAESGIFNRDDILQLSSAGYNNFLIGEALVTSENPQMLIRKLRGVI